MFSTVTLTSAAEDRYYAGSIPVENYTWLENSDGVRDDTLKLGDCTVDGRTGGKLITNADGTHVAGAIVYQFTDAVESVRITAGFSTSSWLGKVTVEASSDGVNFTSAEMTLDSSTGHWWEGGKVYQTNTYTLTTDFTAEENIRYIRVKLPKGSSRTAPGLMNFYYTTHSATATAYSNTLGHGDAFATEGEVLSSGTKYPEAPGYYYFEVSGSLTFAAKDLAPITDFSAVLLLHNVNRDKNLSAQISSDGVNFTTVSLALQKTSAYDNPSWDTSSYNAYGSFAKEDNVRFIKLNLTKTITCVAAFKSFSYNSADMSDSFYANVFDITAASTEEGVTISSGSSGGYKVTDGNSMTFYDENGISDIKAHYADSNDTYGKIYFYASADGETWDDVTGTATATGEAYPGDSNCKKKIFTTSLAPLKGYKYLKVLFKGSSKVNAYLFYIYYNTAAQFGMESPMLDSYERKSSYDVTVAASSDRLTATALDEGASYTSVTSLGNNEYGSSYIFALDGAWKRGYVELYEGGVITDLNIAAFAQTVGHAGKQLMLQVSSDGENWCLINTTKEIYGANTAWGVARGSYDYVSFKPEAEIHYVRLTFNSKVSYLDYAPALTSISYNYVPVEATASTRFDSYEYSIAADKATTITPYVENTTFECPDTKQVGGTYAFVDESGAWQPGEIVFYSDAAITDYCINAISGNATNYGMLEFYGSADGVNYVGLAPTKETHTTHNSSWGNLKGNYFYGKLLASADIHYLKIEYVTRATWVKCCPAVRTVSYNTVETCDNIGHLEGETTTVDATCTTDGSITYVCERCGETVVETIPAKQHSFTDYVSDNNAKPNADGTKTAECDNGCGATDTVTDEGSRFDCIDEEAADLNVDGKIDALDLTELRKVLLSGGDADINGDGVTDVCDLVRLKKYLVNVAGIEINVDSSVAEDSSNMD